MGAVLAEAEPIAGRVAAAPARTVAAGTARLYSAWCVASPVPEAQDQRCEGVADLAGRRARVWEASLSERQAAEFSERRDDDALRRALSEPRETIYDGANASPRVPGR